MYAEGKEVICAPLLRLPSIVSIYYCHSSPEARVQPSSRNPPVGPWEHHFSKRGHSKEYLYEMADILSDR